MSVLEREVVAVSTARHAASGGRLRELRESSKLSQADIARALGVTESTVSRWEAGIRRPAREEALRLAALLDVLERADANTILAASDAADRPAVVGAAGTGAAAGASSPLAMRGRSSARSAGRAHEQGPGHGDPD
jgi:transcriptional regulator with XRE-family HTH domain